MRERGWLLWVGLLGGCVDVPDYDLRLADVHLVVAGDAGGDGPDGRADLDAAPDAPAPTPDGRPPDATQPDGPIPDAGCAERDLGVCAECVAGRIVAPARDDRCAAACPSTVTYVQQDATCLATTARPTGACAGLGACAVDPAVACAPETTVAADATDFCRTLTGCIGETPPALEFLPAGRPCNRFGQCRDDGFCSVSAPCAFATQPRVQRLCFDELRDGQHVCEVYFDANRETCESMCVSQGLTCVTAFGARRDCERESERGCDVENSDIICVCGAEGLPPREG